jgi:hypothetical protein
MPAVDLKIKNRRAHFRKSITSPQFNSDSVLARDAFEFVELWLARNCREALPFWKQAKAYSEASRILPTVSAPLTLYYCFLNCTKALLMVKGEEFKDVHGVSGNWDPSSRRTIANELINIKSTGIVSSLSSYLGESNREAEFSLKRALGNLPFIHRAYRHTYTAAKELFIPIKNPVYKRHPTDAYIWFSAEIEGRSADNRTLRALPSFLERDTGYEDACIIRSKKRYKWFRHGASEDDKAKGMRNLWALHRRMRRNILFISAPVDLWYVRKSPNDGSSIDRSNLVITLAAMHRLSELSRYDPAGLSKYLDSHVNWLVSEFIRLSLSQFVDEISCEITGLEMRMPGVRP